MLFAPKLNAFNAVVKCAMTGDYFSTIVGEKFISSNSPNRRKLRRVTALLRRMANALRQQYGSARDLGMSSKRDCFW